MSSIGPNRPVDDVLEQETPFVIFRIADTQYAVSSDYIVHIKAFDKVTPMINMPAHCLGMIIFDEVSTPVYDLRSAFGIANFATELAESMHRYAQAHEDWVAALETAVADGTPFDRALDPHECAFGQWYYSFNTDNNYFKMYLRNVEEPHAHIHEAGRTALDYLAAGEKDQALMTIDQMKRTHYVQTQEILANMAKVYLETSRAMLIILRVEDKLKAIMVDDIVDIHPLELTHDLPMPPEAVENKYIQCVALDKQRGDGAVIQVFNPAAI